MGPCNTPSLDRGVPFVQMSIQAVGEEEALKHRWIESQKAGRDLGHEPIRGWVNYHWRGFLRERWIEHLQGRVYWVELRNDDFGLLPRELEDSPLLDAIMTRVKRGEENFGIINWAIDTVLPMDKVIAILETLDINSRRTECQFLDRLLQST